MSKIEAFTSDEDGQVTQTNIPVYVEGEDYLTQDEKLELVDLANQNEIESEQGGYRWVRFVLIPLALFLLSEVL